MKTIRIRQHRGGLLESKQTEKEIPATKEAVLEYVVESGMIMTMLPLGADDVVVVPYYEDGKDRIYMVKVFSMPFGFIETVGNLTLN